MMLYLVYLTVFVKREVHFADKSNLEVLLAHGKVQWQSLTFWKSTFSVQKPLSSDVGTVLMKQFPGNNWTFADLRTVTLNKF